MRRCSKIIKSVIVKENDIIGNLKDQWIKPTIKSQRNVSITAGEAAGNTALGYHRGYAWGRAETVRSIVKMPKKQFPEASDYIKTILEYDYKYK